MCGIAGIVSDPSLSTKTLNRWLHHMNFLQRHRGPDGEGQWVQKDGLAGFGHVRLRIIGLDTGDQPMKTDSGLVITYNGEIYNYIELRQALDKSRFRTTSDTEVILKAYEKWGEACIKRLKGMFAFAIWDERKKTLFCARDRFGIKPFYYFQKAGEFYFASEIKALLPFVHEISTDLDSLKEYLVFQFTLGEKTLFKGIRQLMPAHTLWVKKGDVHIKKYWEVHYQMDWHDSKSNFQENVRDLLTDSIRFHLRSDVPVGSYLSGGVDSSIVTSMAGKIQNQAEFHAFHGKFVDSPGYDESKYARSLADFCNITLHQRPFKSTDFISQIRKIIYHLDHPVAGPGSFPQFMTAKLASEHVKVVLSGLGGDEIFGGYVRYLISDFEQCIKRAIEGTMPHGNSVAINEMIIPNLASIGNYIPLLRECWGDGLFENPDKQYFRLVNRANGLMHDIYWDLFEPYSAFKTFRRIFRGENSENVSYFDSMTRFDFQTLLPALLQVEDRMSMAHGVESRVPMLDHLLVEKVATIPFHIKCENGQLKHLLKKAFSQDLPDAINRRTDKMGFPVPFSSWIKGELKEFVEDIFYSHNACHRDYLNPNFDIRKLIDSESKFTRKVWGLLSLELWQQMFHDQAHHHRNANDRIKSII